MRPIALGVVVVGSLVSRAYAQNATSLWGVPIEQPPAGVFAPSAPPADESPDGIGLFFDSTTGTLRWKQAHISHGPSALAHNTPLAGRQWNSLAGSVDYASGGFRTELVGYPDPGVWELNGTVVVAGPTNVEYNILVTIGTTMDQDPRRSGLITGNPVIVGGGVQTWTGQANMPFAIPVAAQDIHCNTQRGNECEVIVWIYPKADGLVSSALAVIGPDWTGGGGLPEFFVTSFTMRRGRQ